MLLAGVFGDPLIARGFSGVSAGGFKFAGRNYKTGGVAPRGQIESRIVLPKDVCICRQMVRDPPVNAAIGQRIGSIILKKVWNHSDVHGNLKNQADGFGSLGIALLAAILFTYLIMVALYDSYVYPFVVLFSIPVAMIGALLALALTMKSLSIFSILGIIMLVGLVGKNAILLVDRTNQMRLEKGLSTYDALLEAGQTRLRPILMTTVAMVVGMLPIALSSEAGAEWKSGLAWALVGGLISSLLLTLVLVPVMYTKVDEWRVKLPAFIRRLAPRRIRGTKPVSITPEPVAVMERSVIG